MTVEEIIVEKVKRLESVPKAFTDNVQSFEKTVYKEILLLFNELEIKGGKVAVTENNLIISSRISDQLKKVFTGKEYLQIVSQYIKEFDEQAKINNSYFIKEFGEINDFNILNAILRKTKTDALLLLTGSSIDANFINPVRSFIDNSIISNSNVKDVVLGIEQIAKTSEGSNSRLLRYSKQIAGDAFSFSDRGYTKVLADNFDVQWFKYQGGQVEDSRCFCVIRHGKYYHRKEIEAWGRGEDLGQCKENSLWQGAYKNTNESNIFSVAGGYNCMHSILPTSIFKVDKSTILRNIKNGNFVPTEKEKELLKLK